MISSDLSMALDELTYANRDSVTGESSKQRGSTELGKTEFLELLVCQLQNQDPLNPQEDTQFISQLAQFSSLEQMTNMNETMTNTSAYSLVGREVIVSSKDEITGKVTDVRGVVDYVERKNGDTFLSIDGKTYQLSDLVQVMDTAYAAKAYLPSVEELELDFNKEIPTILTIPINLGSNGYEANSVAVTIGNDYISPDYIDYDEETKVMTILPGAFENIDTGEYKMGFYFDDPYSTAVTDKVTIKITDSAE